MAIPVCAVSDGRKLGPSAAFFADLEERCQSLRRLHLSKANLTAPLPASVEFLTLSDCSLSPAAFPPTRIDAATFAVTSPRLREVELLAVKLQRGAMSAVPGSVEKLKLRNTRLPRECFQAVAESDGGQAVVSQLAEIDLSDSTSLTDREVADITAAWPHISTLKLNRCTAFHFPIDIIFDGSLEVLELNGVPISDDDIEEICSYLGDTLRRLSIAGCPVTDQSVRMIVAELTNLQSLDVSGCQEINKRFFMAFAGMGETLRYLNVSSTNIANNTVNLLRVCMPECQVVR